jgi:hypothetical protein
MHPGTTNSHVAFTASHVKWLAQADAGQLVIPSGEY